MKRVRNGWLNIFCLLFSVAGIGQDKPAPPSAETIESCKGLIKDAMQKANLVGVGAALILGDGVVWKEGFGYADKENKTPFTTRSVVRIGSVTKPFTALGIMQLQEKGLLDIDQPLVKYLPQFSVKTRNADIKKITVRSVINHTSGLPNDIFLKAWDEGEKYTDTLEYVKKEYLAYPPGTIYHYSNIGYCLLGHAIHSVSKQDYPDYIREHILRPAGMNNSGFLSYDKLSHVSKTYDTDGTVIAPMKQRSIPAGHLFSNIDDMVNLAHELIAIYRGKRGGIVQPQTLKKMFSEQMEKARIDNHKNGLGWGMFKNDSTFAVFHFGSDNVSNAMLVIAPEKKAAAVMLVNTAGGEDIVNKMCSKFLEGCSLNDTDYYITYTRSPESPEPVKISAEALKKHAGIYAHTRGMIIEITLENNEVMMKGGLGDFSLKPVSPDEFIPCKVQGPGKPEVRSKGRIIFKEIAGYHCIIWQDGAQKQQPLAAKLSPQSITDAWTTRLGNYEVVGYKLPGKETFSRAALSVSDNRILQLKISYTSGDYLYNLRIENKNELVFCGFDEVAGGETIQFSKDNQVDVMVIYGLTLKKSHGPVSPGRP